MSIQEERLRYKLSYSSQFFSDRIQQTLPGLPWNSLSRKDELELLVLRPPVPECQDSRAYAVLVDLAKALSSSNPSPRKPHSDSSKFTGWPSFDQVPDWHLTCFLFQTRILSVRDRPSSTGQYAFSNLNTPLRVKMLEARERITEQTNTLSW